MHSRTFPLALLAALSLALDPFFARGALPAGFAETQIASGINSPTCAAIRPDGAIFVCEQGGRVRVWKSGALLASEFATVPCVAFDEQGLAGIAFDPGYNANRWVYFTATRNLAGVNRNVLVRYTADAANPDVAQAGSEVVIFTLGAQAIEYHLGGAIAFGADGKLYTTTGECGSGNGPQLLDNLHGKVLRLNKDGSIPADNPHYAAATGLNRAIFARGFRNPFTFAIQPGAGRIHVNDVGGSSWEEVNAIVAGANCGWPASEGATATPGHTTPLYAYPHGSGASAGDSVTGGDFYNPPTAQFPASYVGRYFFADYVNGWIATLDPAIGAASVVNFKTPQANLGIVDLDTAPDGSLVVLARGQVTLDGGTGAGWDTGLLLRIEYTGSGAPSIGLQPANATVAVGETATFTVTANGLPPLTYQWRKNGADIAGATAASYNTPIATLAENGAQYRCVVTGAGSATSNAAVLTVVNSTRPNATIVTPAAGAHYLAGQTLAFSGTGFDAEDGALPASAFSWRIDLYHDTHAHPAMPATNGVSSGAYSIPANVETSANVFYRVYLSVTDSAGLTRTVSRDVLPTTSTFTIQTNPAALPALLDSQPIATPLTVTGVVGVARTLGVASSVSAGGIAYEFASWSDGGAASHTIATPASATTYTATFREVSRSTEIVNWGGDYVTFDDNVRGYGTPVESGLDLDGDGANDDARWHCPYSDTLAFTPASSAQNPSWRFYGGTLLHQYNASSFAFKWSEIWSGSPIAPADKLYYGGPTGTHGWDLRYWKKPDFLAGGSGATITFGADSRLEIFDYEGGDGVPANNSGRVRFVVRDGAQFYISEDFGAPSASVGADFTLDALPTRRWAPYAPAAPHALRFDSVNAAFALHTFTDITAAGYLHSNDHIPAPATGVKAGFTAARFRVVADRATGPRILQPPQNLDRLEGMSAVFTTAAAGADPLTFQWQKNGANIPGATNATLTFGPLTVGDGGAYRVVVSNATGTVSSTATLTVARRPSLQSTWLPATGGGNPSVRLSLELRPDWRYALFTSTDLAAWSLLDIVTGQTGIHLWDVTVTPGEMKRFYRVEITAP